jgi:single-strand DNA-binding protein
MSDINHVILIGRAAANPELRYTPTGKPVASLRLITNRRYKDRASGEIKEDVSGHNVKIFGPGAEVAQKYIQKGKQVAITGRLATRSYQPEGSAEKRWITEVIVEQFHLLSSPAGEKPPADMPAPEDSEYDDDIGQPPF